MTDFVNVAAATVVYLVSTVVPLVPGVGEDGGYPVRVTEGSKNVLWPGEKPFETQAECAKGIENGAGPFLALLEENNRQDRLMVVLACVEVEAKTGKILRKKTVVVPEDGK